MNKIRENKIFYIQLLNTEGIGHVTFYKLIKKFPSPQEAADFITNSKSIKLYPRDKAQQEFEKADKLGIDILSIDDTDYPQLLKNIYDAPPIIYVRGDKKILSHKSVAVVGSRHASINSGKLAITISADLATAGYNVVSGLAIGIDTYAHIGALKSQGEGRTIAVLAGGVDDIYPKSNRNLYDEIIATGGLIVSENMIGAKPQASFFPKRNRIISGLSLGTVVVEANMKSGSLITANFAKEQGRDVFAVPNFPLDPRSVGTNSLIKDGAILTTSADDIFQNISILSSPPSNNFEFDPTLFKVMEELEDTFSDFTPSELNGKILTLLNSNEVQIDEIMRALHPIPQSNISEALLSLELDDKIAYTSPGKIILKL